MLPSYQVSAFCFIWATERREEKLEQGEREREDSIEGMYIFGDSATCTVGH
jgi:hypothetical protein